MSIGRFYAGIAALIWSPENNCYLLLRRSTHKDVGAGAWECVTGRVDQGEGFEEALHREVSEELGLAVQVEFIIGTTHFYRGEDKPENELLGVVYLCSIDHLEPITVSAEHDRHHWMTREEIAAFLPDDHWLKWAIDRAEMMRAHLPPALREFYRTHTFEMH